MIDNARIAPARASLRVLDHMLVSRMEAPWGRMTHAEFDAWATGVRSWIANTQTCLEPERIEAVGAALPAEHAPPEPIRAVTGSVRSAADYYLSHFTGPSGTFIGTMRTEDFIQRAGELARVLDGSRPALAGSQEKK